MIAIRIQLGAMPPMLGDMVVQMLGGADTVEIVGRSASDVAVLRDAHAAKADLLVVSSSASGPIAAIEAAVDLDILAISGDAHSGALLRVACTAMTLDRDSLAALPLTLQGRA